jgi:glutamine synthetase
MRRLQLKKYLDLPQKGKVMAEYVWIDGSNGLRSKSKVSLFQLSDLPTRRFAAFATPAEVDPA